MAVMDTKVLDVYKVVVRVDTKNISKLIEKIKSAGFKIAEVTEEDE